MEHYDGEFYTLRLFSPIEGEIYSLNSTEEGIHLTAYEMENYSSFIRDHMEGVGLLGKRNQKLMTYFNNAKRLHKPVSLSLDLEAYEGRLWSVLQADSQDKLTHEEVQSLAETWGMIAAGGFIREMQETRILVPDGELMVFLGNEGLDYFVCPEEVLKGTAHTLKPALDVAIYSEAYFPERSYQGAKLRLPAEPAFLKDAKMRAFIHENEPYRIELLGNWPSFLKNILEKAASVTLEEVNVLACLVTHMDSSQIETYEAAIQMRQEENIDVLVGIKELLNLCYNLECFKFLRGIIDDRKLGEFYLEEDRLEWIHMLEVDIRELLDPQRVGMDQRKEEMGIFTSKGYVFENALSYQDIYDGIHLPDIDGVAGGIFSLRLVGSQYPEEQGTWLELPTTDLGFQWALNRLNESYYQELEDGKKLEDVWQKIAQDYQKCQEAEISIDGISSREWDYETIKKSLTVYVRNAQENIDFLASCPHEIREDLALVYGFHVLVDGEKAGSAIINYDRLRWLGVSEEQLKQDAWENMKQSNPPCFLDLQDMLAKMYSDELGDVKAGSLEYLEDVDPKKSEFLKECPRAVLDAIKQICQVRVIIIINLHTPVIWWFSKQYPTTSAEHLNVPVITCRKHRVNQAAECFLSANP